MAPEYGRRLIPSTIDEIASDTPDKPYCYLSRTTITEDGFWIITFKDFSNAINACAWWIRDEIGEGKDFDTLAYLGPSDLRNIIIILAAIKTGHKALLASPRNSLAAHLNLLESTQCHTLLMAEPLPPLAKNVLSHRPMRHVVVPDVENWLGSPEIAPYPFSKSFVEARYHPFVVVHTSGSTGLPKPVVVSHGTMAANDAFNETLADDEADTLVLVLDVIRNKKCFLSMPLFHMAGIDYMLPKAIFHGITPILGPAVPMTAELVDAMHQQDLIEISVVAPSVLQDLALSQSSLEHLEQIEAVITGGGPLSSSAGNAITRKTELYNSMGSSEMVSVPTAVLDREDWEYFKFSPKIGYHLRQYSGDLYELGFIRQPHLDCYQAVFSTFPDLQEYFTNDLYTRHPMKPDLWKYSGRADDIIVLSNGEKINPTRMERLIEVHPAIRSALIVGQARFQTALLVEARNPPQGSVTRNVLIEDIWPTIQKANAECDAHARLSKDLITFASPQKPFLRAGKGTVQRRMTVELYMEEINQIYDNLERFAEQQVLNRTRDISTRTDTISTNLPMQDLTLLENWLLDLIYEVTGWIHLKPDADFFSLGMDSLQVINLVRALNANEQKINIPVGTITPKAVYANPTLRKLAQVCSRQIIVTEPHEDKSASSTGIEEMEQLLSKYSWNLPITCRPTISRLPGDPMYVLLTGSTGSLGSYLLHNLLANPQIAHVYCLNRSSNSKAQQKISNDSRGLFTNWTVDRVTFLQNHVSQEYLGLSASIYRALLSKVTHIIHNAWEVNFNLPISSFDSHLLGVRQYIDFSARSAKGAAVQFISSISSCMSSSLSPVPEQIIEDPRAPAPIGYAQSKHVAERILARAAEQARVPAAIYRVGQIAGPIGRGGCWSKQEWLPSLIASSKYLGKVPGSLGANDRVDWVPVDVVSRVLVELLGSSNDSKMDTKQDVGKAAFYHVVNPKSTTWESLLPVVKEYFADVALETVSLREWIDALGESAKGIGATDGNPGIRLLNFYESLVESKETVFETGNTVCKSDELAKLEAVKPEWMKNWLEQWKF